MEQPIAIQHCTNWVIFFEGKHLYASNHDICSKTHTLAKLLPAAARICVLQGRQTTKPDAFSWRQLSCHHRVLIPSLLACQPKIFSPCGSGRALGKSTLRAPLTVVLSPSWSTCSSKSAPPGLTFRPPMWLSTLQQTSLKLSS